MSKQNLDPRLLSGAVTSPLGDLIIPVEHFGHCPFHELTEAGFGTSHWSISRGGFPVPDGVWTIDIFQRDESGKVHQDRWVLPDCFAILFRHFEGCGDKSRLRMVKAAIGM